MAWLGVGFHGDYSRGSALYRDAGRPWFMQDYPNWQKTDDVRYLREEENLVLLGYSSGGSHIGHLTHQLRNIRLAILYESPLLGIDEVAGDFPVLMIWNRRGRWRTDEARETEAAWARTHPVTRWDHGHGRHTKFVPYWPFIGHGWDLFLNDQIGNWIDARMPTERDSENCWSK